MGFCAKELKKVIPTFMLLIAVACNAHKDEPPEDVAWGGCKFHPPDIFLKNSLKIGSV